jgi:hypothetical protein
MFTGYARSESVAAAARETFDPAKPCAICRAVSSARSACERHGPAVPSAGAEKMVLIFEKAAPFVAVASPGSWPEIPAVRAPERCTDVPVPPPKAERA